MIKGAEKEFGELYKIQIRKDKNGNDWHLDNITLHRDGEIKPISFGFDQWIKKEALNIIPRINVAIGNIN